MTEPAIEPKPLPFLHKIWKIVTWRWRLQLAINAPFGVLWVADKTNWRKMLKHDVVEMDLESERDRVLDLAKDALAAIEAEYAGQITRLNEKAWSFEYPSLAWPTKITTHNLDKQPVVEGVLQAIKGQYLIFEDQTVFNIRSNEGRVVEITIN